MSQSDRKDSATRDGGFDWLDPAGASEPYDWTLKDGSIRITQVIPITPKVQGDSAKLGGVKRNAYGSESSTTTPLEKVATGNLFRRSLTRLLRPVTTAPLAPAPRVESNRTGATRRFPGLALPLLLLAVIALFIFAYIAQK